MAKFSTFNIAEIMKTSVAPAVLFSSQIALAQPAPTSDDDQDLASQQGGLSEIVVTAQKRSQSVQDVPIAITAYSGDEIAAAGFRESTDISRLSAGVNVSTTNGGATQQFSVRGVSQNDFNDQGEGPNAIYIDEAYLAFGNGGIFGIFDVERVEVLKGPQGTLFGRNATGGLAHFITNKPGNELDGFIDASYGSNESVRLEAALGGPITDSLSARVAFLYDANDSFNTNVYPAGAQTNGGPGAVALEGAGEDEGQKETVGVRGHLLFEPSVDFSALLSVAYNRTDFSTPAYYNRATIAVVDALGRQVDSVVAGPGETRSIIGPGGVGIGPGRPVPGGNFFGALQCTPAGVEALTCSRDFAFEDVNTNEAFSATGKLTWNLSDDIVLTSISDYKDFKKDLFLDADGGPQTLLTVANVSDVSSFAQELRLNGEADRLTWVAGLYYLNIDNNTTFSLNGSPDSLTIGPLLPGPADVALLSQTDTNSYSIFGHVEYELTDTLSAIAGLRYVREEKDFVTQETVFANIGGAFVVDTDVPIFDFRPQTAFVQNQNLWSGKAQLNWKPNNDVLVYAGVSRGVKAGNFNTPITFGAGFNNADIPYDREVLWAYEAGIKSDLLDGRLRLNGSVYYYDYTDYQVFLFNNITNFVQNADAKYFGLELDAIVAPVDGLEFGGSFAYIDATVKDVQVDDASPAPGDELILDRKPTFTPEVQLSGFVDFEFPQEVLGGYIGIRSDITYYSSQFADIRNFQTSRLDSFVSLNARVSWTSADERFELYFSGSNLLDERNRVSNTDTASLFGSDEFSVSRPVWVTGGVRFKFN